MSANSLYFSRNVNRQIPSVVSILSLCQTIATFQRNISQHLIHVWQPVETSWVLLAQTRAKC